MDISVVIPVYGCPDAIPELHKRLVETLNNLVQTYEIILVNDACPKGSWNEIKKICARDPKVIGINLSRNFGQNKAIMAGLDSSCGDWVVVMDCDLQDRPEAIADLYHKAIEGYDIVFASRVDRVDKKTTKFFSKVFYKVYGYFIGDEFDSTVGNYSIANRKVIDAFSSSKEFNKDYSTYMVWLGYKNTTIEAIAEERHSGESSYSMVRKIKLAFEIITTHSNKPLLISINIGFMLAFFALIFLLYVVISYLLVEDYDAGWPSLIGSLYLIGGLLMSSIGIMGIYVGNIYTEAKQRPLYFIAEKINAGE